MTLKEYENLKIGDLVITKTPGNYNNVYPVANINRETMQLRVGRTGKWRNYRSFNLFNEEFIVKFLRRISYKNPSNITITSDKNIVIIRINK